MKKLVVLTIALLSATSAFAVTSRSISEVWVSTDEIKVLDKQNSEWIIKQDCNLYLSKNSDVKVTTINNVLKPNSKILVNVDGSRNVCRIIDIVEVAHQGVS